MKQWRVEIFIDEDGRQTYAKARLETQRESRLQGTGSARRNPRDTDIPEIGDELAVARALSDLAHKLLHAAAEDIEAVTHQPAHLRS
ncbi:MAG: DUF1876 domain-containing protein [Carbonactinosporaceae bacterium]